MYGMLPVYMYVLSIIQIVYIWCTMSALFFSDMYLNSRCWCFFFCFFNCLSVVLPCHVSFLMQTPQKGGRIVVALQMFLPMLCVFVFVRHCCIHTDVSPEWTWPKLNPTVRLSCVFVKDAMLSSEKKTKKTAGRQLLKPTRVLSYTVMTLVVSGVTVTQVFQKVPTTSLSYSYGLGLTPIFLSSEKTDNEKKKIFKKNKKKSHK